MIVLLFSRVSLLLLLLLSYLPRSACKTVTGDFKLSGLNSHHVLTTFAVVPDGGRVSIEMNATAIYENERFLKFRLYRDVEWPKFIKANVCEDRIKYAKQTLPVSFDYRDKKWRSNPISVLIINTPDNVSYRPHYWYVVMDDCSLEQYMQDEKMPTIHYELDILNNVVLPKDQGMVQTHLSADEMPLKQVHTVTMMISGLLTFFLLMMVVMQLHQKGIIHAAVLWVAAASALDTASSLCEIIHVKIYEKNGIGSYAIDAMAAHMEAACDALIILLLLAIAAGWTLPSDVTVVNANQTFVQKLLTQMSHPIGAIQSGNLAALMGILVLLLHAGLAQWGRTYNDDFDSYHDLQHLPGKILMGLRISLGVLLLAATVQTRWKCTTRPLKAFYGKLALVGFIWFQSLPLLVFCCNVFVPYYLIHPAVYCGSALLQSTSLVMLSWLVTAHSTAYHKVSSMTADKDASLTSTLRSTSITSTGSSGGDNGTKSLSSSMLGADSNAKTSMFSLGKAKIRLD